MIDLDDLADRLRRLGDDLAFDDDSLVASVAARIDAAPRRRGYVWLAVAAAVITAVPLVWCMRHLRRD